MVATKVPVAVFPETEVLKVPEILFAVVPKNEPERVPEVAPDTSSVPVKPSEERLPIMEWFQNSGPAIGYPPPGELKLTLPEIAEELKSAVRFIVFVPSLMIAPGLVPVTIPITDPS